MSLFFFNDTATTEIYALSLHDALPISPDVPGAGLPARTALPSGCGVKVTPAGRAPARASFVAAGRPGRVERESIRLNPRPAHNSHGGFCLEKKNTLPFIIALFYVYVPH